MANSLSGLYESLDRFSSEELKKQVETPDFLTDEARRVAASILDSRGVVYSMTASEHHVDHIGKETFFDRYGPAGIGVVVVNLGLVLMASWGIPWIIIIPLYISGFFYVSRLIKKASTTRLMKASAAGDVGEVSRLIALGDDVNEPDNDGGATALMYAARNNHSDVVEVLLKSGASLTAKTKAGHTAEWFAINNCHESIAKLIARFSKSR